MPNLTLYHASPSRSSVVLWMLEELGEPYDIKLLKLGAGENMKPDYLAINPMGKVPALKHGDTAITELAAICTYLADEFPEKKLNVPIGTPKRGVYLKFGYGDFDTTLNVLAKAVEKGPWLMGDQFTAADVVIGANIRWGMIFKMVPERKEFVDYAARIAARPAAQRAEAKDKELGAQAA
jgi:glutathione S-transferase